MLIACRAGRDLARSVVPSQLLGTSRTPIAGFAKKKGEEEGVGRDSKTHRLLKIVDQLSEDEMPKLTPEEDKLWKAATKEYNRLKMIEHRAWQTDLSIKFKLKQAALAALPEHLRTLADRTQEELVPPSRQIFTQTPPIPGFRDQESQQSSSKRGRGGRR